jgi:hypothetical protein
VLKFGLGNLWSVLDWKWEWSHMDWSSLSWVSWCNCDGNWLNGSDWVSSICNCGCCDDAWGGDDGRSDEGGLWGWSDWEVGSSNSETVDWVRDVVDSLGDTVGINVAVSTSGHSESVLALRFGTWTSRIAIAVLAKFILSMELGGGQSWGNNATIDELGCCGRNCQKGGENDSGMHFWRL